MDKSEAIALVAKLANKAALAGNATEAMQYSQAACNTANALRVLADGMPGQAFPRGSKS